MVISSVSLQHVARSQHTYNLCSSLQTLWHANYPRFVGLGELILDIAPRLSVYDEYTTNYKVAESRVECDFHRC